MGIADIVIVNWNSNEYLLKCVQSIFTPTNKPFVGTVFIIDNASSDNSIKVLPAHSKIKIVTNSQNNGFSKACNQGFKLCTSPYVLLLNPDAQLSENTLKDCIAFMEGNSGVDIMGCQLLDESGHVAPSCSRFPSAAGIFRDAIGLSKIAPSVFHPATVMTDWNHQESRYVDQVMGAFMFMRLTIFEKVGYFDEQFFVYFEEVDFSKRLSELKGRTYFSTEIKALHSGEGTTQSVKAFRLFLLLRSRLQYAKKHFSYSGYLFSKISTYFIEPFSRSCFALIKGKPREVKEVYQAYKRLILAK